MPLNSPMRRLFGVPGQPVVVGAHGTVATPQGRGVLVRSLARHAGQPQQLVETAKGAGLTWVPVLGVWQYDGQPPPRAQAQQVAPNVFQKIFNPEVQNYAQALGQNGIATWLWGHPKATPEALTAFTQLQGPAAKQAPAQGIIVELGPTWEGAPAEAAQALISSLRQIAQMPIVVAVSSTQNLAWESLATADAAIVLDGTQGAEALSGRFSHVVPVVKASSPTKPETAHVLWDDWHTASQEAAAWGLIRGA